MLTNALKGELMDWKEVIHNYTPKSKEEEKYKEIFLYSMDYFNDILTRHNPIVHLTSSAFIVNNKFDRALMVYHNIYNSWSWTGGHVDGETDFLKVAIKEAKEETGILVKPITPIPLSIDVLSVIGHFKKGEYIAPHLHLSIAYGALGDEDEVTMVKKDENSAVKWIPIEEVNTYSTENHMKNLYNKLIHRILEYKNS